ncbi:SET domain-containing protein 9 isoform X2 [Cajanus cajan]|nr:SET domain-containing protein 9 isoform X2 [Cajanus cajan]XP_029127162.1 SET domain-containing protein 9 isoform X2 [Cajanus cajan]XP_029127163.1 SET domain-containing protein 9 isoform X2 [Cajanus cajan]XP_029127164.1 SET domain-containing protein 9 isoform X2 [Cajanus cajan]
MQVQENVHSQIKTFCLRMDEILIPNEKMVNDHLKLSQQANSSLHHSGLCSANAVSKQRPLSQADVSQKLKDKLGYTLNIKPSQISHKNSGQGLFLDGAVDLGAVLAFYPGVVYSPAYYHYVPGYHDEQNPYLIRRYDGTVIDAQPWVCRGDGPERFNGRKMLENKLDNGDDDVVERRNPLAVAHFANHPAKGLLPNVMICPYDFPLTENSMRVYIPNISFGNAEVSLKRFGSFWFKSGISRNSQSQVPTLKTVVLVATRALEDEELLLNYRLCNSKQWPEWYAPVDEEDEMTGKDESSR